eukprot:TRINITY_DN17185_c0_g1_i1.p2 TRINITY_DN17185_c0_g1~~TRINITY_DN17185_c0_g1_i1.p2  ORF type:complete len:129 (+),score=4.75 TRINITY_DN17185_c0_g1_i1:629-1015(+)
MLFSTMPFISILTNFTILNAIYNDLQSSCTKEYDGYVYHMHKFKCALIVLFFCIPSIVASWIVPIPSKQFYLFSDQYGKIVGIVSSVWVLFVDCYYQWCKAMTYKVFGIENFDHYKSIIKSKKIDQEN